ncbi:class V lanthionine synthetase subunit LxmK [Streptomyces syringium]|uniref:class V lanthionine synthetase subunit LxmK n=1 Tax=Streptomyces syringium TaxID=76729 RepID=UPI0033A4CFCD
MAVKEAAAEIPAYKPRDLDEYPAVDALLERLGLGPYLRDTLSAPVGRNDCWAGETAGGGKAFVKHLVGPEPDVKARMRRLKAFEQCSAAMPSSALRGPRFLGFDEEADLVAFEYVEGARNGAQLMVDETFDGALAERVGRAIGLLHEARPPGWEDFDDSPPSQPSVRLLHGIPLPMFENFSFGEVQSWQLMQQDEQLVKAVEALREKELAAPKVPSHCDLRVDQFLVSDEEFHVTDWEEFRLADPARDVGAFAGEWLYRSVLDIVTDRGDTVFLDVELTHELVIERGVEKMQRLLPLVREFWRGYREVRPVVDEGLAHRATAFAGWHLLDRLMASSQKSARLSGIERAAAGIGRAALLAPHKFAATLGFEETT